MMNLTGEVALVTGATRGIGAAIAQTLARQGAVVIGTATTEDGAGRVDRMLRDAPVPGRGMVLDVSSSESVNAGFASLGRDDLMPGILVNNAGIVRDGLLARMDDEQWDSVIDTDLTSLYRTCRACVRHLMKRRGGRIVNVTSVVGFTGNAGQTNYAAAKAGIVGFTRALAKELAGRSITVNAVAPGFIETDMTWEIAPETRDRMIGLVPLGRLGAPEEAAAAVAFSRLAGRRLHHRRDAACQRRDVHGVSLPSPPQAGRGPASRQLWSP